jgi:hypothetical protein
MGALFRAADSEAMPPEAGAKTGLLLRLTLECLFDAGIKGQVANDEKIP